MSGKTKPDLYFSCDIEADGPIPGPEHLLGTREHTHNALDDAKGQADLLQNLMGWDGRS